MTIMNIDKYGDDLVHRPRPTHEGNILLTTLHLNPGIDINISADKRYLVGNAVYEGAINLLARVIADNGDYDDAEDVIEKCYEWLDNGIVSYLSDMFYDYYEGLKDGNQG